MNYYLGERIFRGTFIRRFLVLFESCNFVLMENRAWKCIEIQCIYGDFIEKSGSLQVVSERVPTGNVFHIARVEILVSIRVLGTLG